MGNYSNDRRSVAHWVARSVYVVGSNTIKGSRCFLEQETLPVLLSTGWFRERLRAWYHNGTKINGGPYRRWT